ncbi:MAG: DinB family protein [Chloroflexota bacterium]
MISKAGIMSLFEYHYARHRQIWESCMRLSEAQFEQAMPYSHGSLREQWIHLLDDDAKWLAFLMGSKMARLASHEFPNRALIKQAYDQIESSALDFVKRVDESILEHTYTWHVPIRSEPQYVKGWQILVHMVNHGTDHRAQILRILHDFGAPSFDQDLLGYWLMTDQLKQG